jgi:hypothetical protein
VLHAGFRSSIEALGNLSFRSVMVDHGSMPRYISALACSFRQKTEKTHKAITARNIFFIMLEPLVVDITVQYATYVPNNFYR